MSTVHENPKHAMRKIIKRAYQHAHADDQPVADQSQRRPGYDRTLAMIERLTHR